jgi:LPXTG-motif cell wall-anchored protein
MKSKMIVQVALFVVLAIAGLTCAVAATAGNGNGGGAQTTTNGNGNGNGGKPKGGDNSCPPSTHEVRDSDGNVVSCEHNGDGGGNCGQNQSDQGNGGNGGDHGYGNKDGCGTTTTTTTPETVQVCKDGKVQTEPAGTVDDGSCNVTTTTPTTTTTPGGCVSNCGGGTTTTTTTPTETTPPTTTTPAVTPPVVTPPVVAPPVFNPKSPETKKQLQKQIAKSKRGVQDNAPVASGALPHTGFNAGLMALAGALLLASGLGLRRVGSKA